MDKISKIENAIKECLDSFLESRISRSKSNKVWTKAIKKRLGKLGLSKFNSSPCTSVKEKDFEGAWLYDLVWYISKSSRDNTIKNIPLIVEIEWDMKFNGIRYDFDKLIIGRAELRVLIYQAKNKETIDKFNNELIKRIKSFKYSMKGDRYLFIAFNWEGGVIYKPYKY
jgi:hypothetical protein